MTPINTETDFRDAAIQASSRIVDFNGSLPWTRSVCVANPVDTSEDFKRLKRVVLLRFTGGMLSLVAGGFFAYFDIKGGQIGPLTLVGFACGLRGLILVISIVYFERRFTHKIIANRYDDLAAISTEFTPVCVSIENAATFNKVKLVPEELGYLGLDSRNRRVLIEGIRCRYSICAPDVVQITQSHVGTSSATLVTYHAAGVPLSITIQYENFWHEFKKYFGVFKDPLIDRICDTLDFVD